MFVWVVCYNQLSGTSLTKAHSVTPFLPPGCPYVLSPTLGARPGGELTFYGSALQAPALAALLQRCSPHAIITPSAEEPCNSTSSPSSTTTNTTSAAAAASVTLTKEQRAAIREAHLFDALPEGYCFNGLAYYDAFGDRSNEHPDMNDFIALWAAGQAEEQRVNGEKARALEAGDMLVLLRVVACVV